MKEKGDIRLGVGALALAALLALGTGPLLGAEAVPSTDTASCADAASNGNAALDAKPLLGAERAWADDELPGGSGDVSQRLDDVRAELAQKTAELADLADAIEAEAKRISAIDGEMEGLLAELSLRQREFARLQDDAASMATLMYKDGEDFNIFILLEESGSLDEFLHRMAMRDHILATSSDMLDQLKRAQSELDASYAEASAKKDEQNELMADAKEKQRSLNETIAELQKREKDLDLEQKAALAQAAARAHEVAKTFATEDAAGSDNSSTAQSGSAGQASSAGAGASGDADSGNKAAGSSAEEKNGEGAGSSTGSGAGSTSASADSGSSNASTGNASKDGSANTSGESGASKGATGDGDAGSGANAGSKAESDAGAGASEGQVDDSGSSGTAHLKADGSEPDADGWRTGLASAYGGSSDKSTPNPGTTATGTRCDDWSVGVAVPIVWGPADYYGHYVEISYDGQSIVAPIVDCGGMGNGARALDLQPGVFKAFGAKTCADWGVREVRYRFL